MCEASFPCSTDILVFNSGNEFASLDTPIPWMRKKKKTSIAKYLAHNTNLFASKDSLISRIPMPLVASKSNNMKTSNA